jgi:hypothetical protein
MYDGVDEMPIVRYHKFTQLLIIASGVGSDMEAAKQKVADIRRYLANGEPKKADMELTNLHQALSFIYGGIDPRSAAFACMVKSIDGEEQTDMSQAALDALGERINAIVTKGERDGILDAIKKKLKET